MADSADTVRLVDDVIEELRALKAKLERPVSEALGSADADVSTKTEDTPLEDLAQIVMLTDACGTFAVVETGKSLVYKKNYITDSFDYYPDHQVQNPGPRNLLPFRIWTVKVALQGWALRDTLPQDVLKQIDDALLPLLGPVYVLIFAGVNDVR